MNSSQQTVLDYLLSSEKGEINNKKLKIGDKTYTKICTSPARESDSEVKIVETPGSRSVFWSSKLVQSAFRVAGAGISTQHPHKNR